MVFVSALMLRGLGLSTVVQSVASSVGGRPIWLHAKKTPDVSMAEALAVVGISEHTTPIVQCLRR